MFEIGSVCVKTHGRTAGRYVVIVKEDKDFVEITGPKELNGVKRKKCNKKHLMPVNIKINIKEGASDADIIKEIEKAKLDPKFKSRVRISV